MTLIFKLISRTLWMLMIALTVVCALSFTSSAMAQEQEQGSRQIVLDEFTKARPAKSTTAPSSSNPTARTRPRPPSSASRVGKRPTYRRASGTPSVASASSKRTSEELGMTVWRLRQAKTRDIGQRMLVRERDKSSEWIPERIEADTPLREGDRVRLSIESPREGYLYIIDRDLYSDGKMGDAMLIFPSLGMRGGDNQVRAGKLIDIPPEEEDPNYFTAKPNRNDQVGEVLTIIVTAAPINLPIGHEPLLISAAEIAKWEKEWGSETERFEMEGGAGQAWTKEEQQAATSKSTKQLTQADPSPQTIYRLSMKQNRAFLVNLRLAYAK